MAIAEDSLRVHVFETRKDRVTLQVGMKPVNSFLGLLRPSGFGRRSVSGYRKHVRKGSSGLYGRRRFETPGRRSPAPVPYTAHVAGLIVDFG